MGLLPTTSTTTEQEWTELLELLAAQSISCGILTTTTEEEEEDSSAHSLVVSSLVDLANLLQPTTTTTTTTPATTQQYYYYEDQQSPDDDKERWLIQVEQAATTVREKCQFFLEHLQASRIEMAAFGRELEALGQKREDCRKVILQSRSLIAAFRKKTFVEQLTVQDILDKLQDLYSSNHSTSSSGGGNMRLAMALRNAASELSQQQQEHLESPQFQGILSLMDLWRGAKTSKSKRQEGKIGSTKDTNGDRPSSPQLQHDKEEGQNFLTANAKELPLSMKRFSFLRRRQSPGIHRILLVGPEGSGKTHACNLIASFVADDTQVFRFHSSGRTIGETEDSIISFFNNIASSYQDSDNHYLLLVDDIDSVIGSMDHHGTFLDSDLAQDQRQRHSTSRALSTFLAMLDSLVAGSQECRSATNSSVMLIGTSSSNINANLSRFDEVVKLEPPGYEERREVLAGFVGPLSEEGVDDNLSETQRQEIDSLLKNVADSMIGMSFAEISQCYRRAIMSIEEENKVSESDDWNLGQSSEFQECIDVLRAMQNTLQSFTPSSFLNGGETDGFVDMRVLNSKDLSDPVRGFSKECLLYGPSVEVAWKELESLIVVPLCRASALNELSTTDIRQQTSSTNSLRGGVLLTGGPGCGKSSLARHCAALAASLLPSVKLLEVSCTSMIQKEVGSSERAIRRLFDCARSAAPCIVILDDVAIISSVRGNDNTTEGTMDRVLSTLLTELDGVDRQAPSPSHDTSSKRLGFAVIGITQNEKWIDPSLLRPGRLGKIVKLGLPEKEARLQIAMKELEMFKREDVQSDKVAPLANTIAERTEGLNGASVIAVCNDAKRSIITKNDGEKLPDLSEMLDLMCDFVLSLPKRS